MTSVMTSEAEIGYSCTADEILKGCVNCWSKSSAWTQQIYLRNLRPYAFFKSNLFRFSQHSGKYELWNDLKVLLLVK
jgi:hypothetical protein